MGEAEESEDAQFPDNDELAPYVTGQALGSRGGRRVTLWGHVTRVTADGFCMRVGADEAEVQVRMSAGATPAGWVEVAGVVQGRVLLADECVVFPAAATEHVDAEGYRGLARLLAALDDPWNLGDDETSGVKPME